MLNLPACETLGNSTFENNFLTNCLTFSKSIGGIRFG